MSRRRARARVGTRGSAKAAPSARPRRSSTPSPTRFRRSACASTASRSARTGSSSCSTVARAEPPRRAYDSPVRRQRVAETRERIVAAGAELLHGFPIWNWDALTPGAVAEHAGVTERTVYRYFGSERELRDAVMARMEHEA